MKGYPFAVRLLALVGVALALSAVSSYVLLITSRSAQAATQSTNFKWEVGLSGYVITNPSSATPLTGAGLASAENGWFTVKGGDLCVSISATPATPTNSMRWPEGSLVPMTNDGPALRRMTVINCDNSDPSTTQVYFSRKWRAGDSQ